MIPPNYRSRNVPSFVLLTFTLYPSSVILNLVLNLVLQCTLDLNSTIVLRSTVVHVRTRNTKFSIPDTRLDPLIERLAPPFDEEPVL
jgi:hypothetical protein